jgi:hypothetical protein
MGFLPKLPAGMRLIQATGVIVMDRPVLPPELAKSPLLDEMSLDGRTQRERFSKAQRVLDRLAAGWRPSDVKLQDAPTLTNWRILVLRRKIILGGIVHGHPHIADGHACLTSPMIAIDAVLARWARTVSRWYVLCDPYRDEEKL